MPLIITLHVIGVAIHECGKDFPVFCWCRVTLATFSLDYLRLSSFSRRFYPTFPSVQQKVLKLDHYVVCVQVPVPNFQPPDRFLRNLVCTVTLEATQTCSIHLNKTVALKTETARSSETSEQTYPTPRKNPKDRHLSNTHLEKLRTYDSCLYFETNKSNTQSIFLWLNSPLGA